jgi:bifunctional non-homologous end joining protein LigD
LSGSEWLHELKFDGYRMHARLDRGAVRLLTRTGLDWTHKYQATAEAVASLPAREAYLDGELCGVRSDGITGPSCLTVPVFEIPEGAVPAAQCRPELFRSC